jgi:glucose-6-phosphate 1-dehydrogenase
MIRTLVLLGVTGDLAKRYLLPALGALDAAGRLPSGFSVVGAARGELDADGLRRLAGDDLPPGMLTYRSVDLADPASVRAALDGVAEAAAVYLALPPRVFTTTIETLGEVGLPSGSRIVVEKPFGDDAESARQLNALLADEDAYRVDHVLGMETVHNLVAMRRANAVLEQLWNGESVEQVDILWEETLALEGRAGFYDHAGALKDVLQNHMLQLLALVGMEPSGNDSNLQERKLAVLRSARPAHSRRARYTAGQLADGREVPSYADEEGVDPDRFTETFAEVALELDSPRWSGTRFVLRAGKALSRQRKLVLLRFRDEAELEIGIDGPEEVVLRLSGGANKALELRAEVPGEGLPAYAHVLLDVLGGTSALSVGGEEAEQAWRVVAPVLDDWETGRVPLEEYPAGSAGPAPEDSPGRGQAITETRRPA